MGFFSDMFEGFRNFVNESLEAGRSSVNTAVFSDMPHSCAYCICCKQTIKTTSFGKVITFTCPREDKDGSNYFPSNIPAATGCPG